MTLPALQVLYEDNHCLAVVKPPRVLTAGDETGDVSLLEVAREYIKRKHQKPGNVFLGVVHRLDRPVSGVVLFARTSKAAARLSEQFRTGRVRKVYHALVEGTVSPPAGELVDWLVKDRERNIVRSVAEGTPEARKALLEYRTLGSAGKLTLLEVAPLTGRSHQIRVQLAARGTPIYGDAKYGSRHAFDDAIALHARELTFEHPVRREQVTVRADYPEAWRPFLPDG